MFGRRRSTVAGLPPMPFGPGGGFMPSRPQRFRNLRRLARLVRWLCRRGYTHRRKLAPVYAAVSLYLVAGCAHFVPAGARSVGWMCITGGALGGLLHFGRHRRGRPVKRHRAIHLWAAFVSGSLWLLVATRVGDARPMPGILLIWMFAVGVPQWWHHRIRHTPPVGLDTRVTTWDDLVAVSGGALPESRLTELEVATAIDHESGKQRVIGWTAIIELPPGKLTSAAAINAVTRVASAFGLPVTSVAIEPVEGGQEHLARLTVLTVEKNPMATSRPFTPSLDSKTGVTRIATYVDGGPAMYRFWAPSSGPWHDLIAGTTGSGKSRLIDLLLAEERRSPLIASVIIDPQNGQSLPAWRRHVALFADTAELGMAVLYAVRDEMYRRSRLLSRVEWIDEDGDQVEGIEFFDPTHPVIRELGLPLLVLTIEEAPTFLALPGARAITEDLAKMARKCGIKLRLICQVPLLDQLGSTTLRDQVASGNVVVLRTGNKLSGAVAFNGNLPVDPSTLPREWPDGTSTAGLAYVLGPGARPTQCRVDFVEKPHRWARAGTLTELLEVVTSYEQYAGAGQQATNAEAATPAGPAAADATAIDKIVAYLAELKRPATTGALARELNLPRSTVSTACTRGAAAGRVEQVRHGMWSLPTSAAAEAVDEPNAQLEPANAA